MGTQGFSGRAVFGGRDARASWRRITMLAASLVILPLAAGCSGSSFPSFGSSNPQSQAASVPPPPDVPAGQQAHAPPPGQPSNPPASYATAPPAAQTAASSDGATVGSFKSSYVSFLKAFRDPDPDQGMHQ
jgi:hypothetical protein